MLWGFVLWRFFLHLGRQEGSLSGEKMNYGGLLIVPLSRWFLDHLVRYLLFLVNVAWKQSSPIYFCVLYNVWWVRCFIKQTQSMPRSCLFYTHCFLFSFIMYLLALRHGRENIRTAWWYLLSACWEPKILRLMSVYSLFIVIYRAKKKQPLEATQ